MPVGQNKLCTTGIGISGLAALGAHVLHGEQFLLVKLGINLALELTGSAVSGLYVQHGESVIDGNTGAFVLLHVMIRMGLADQP